MSDTQDEWWEAIPKNERDMACVICSADNTGSPHRMVYPFTTPEKAISPKGFVSVIYARELVPLWTMFLWQARAALRVKGSAS